MKGITFGAVCVAAMLLPSTAGQAWSHQGHMTTGAIAFDDLAAHDPAVIDAVSTIMASHPDAPRFARNLGALKGPARTRTMFKYMARWADDIRNTPADRPTWHYGLRLVSSWRAIHPQEDGDARAAFAKNLSVAADGAAPASARAVALCWLFHITGDIQQPLHAGHWASLGFPRSDRGGSISLFRKTPTGPTVDLHQFWDFAIDEPGDDALAADRHAARIEAGWPRAKLPEVAPASGYGVWADESMRLAWNTVYVGDGMKAVSLFGAIPVVSPRYANIAWQLSSRRVADGGYRLADVLRDVVRRSAKP